MIMMAILVLCVEEGIFLVPFLVFPPFLLLLLLLLSMVALVVRNAEVDNGARNNSVKLSPPPPCVAAAISRPELNRIRPILVARRKKAKSGVDFCEWMENWRCSVVGEALN